MKRSFYLFNPGIMERKDNTLKYTPVKIDDEGTEHPQPPRYIPVEDVAEMYVFGSLRANSALYNFLGQKDIPVHFFDYYENYTGSFMPRDGLLSGRALLAQAKVYQNKKKRTLLAAKFIQGAAWNMVMNLNYYHRRGKDLGSTIDGIKTLAKTLPSAADVEEVMGIEGNIRKLYYDAFDVILDDYKMGARTKQPPQNEVNALISFGNMMCYTKTLQAIHQTQLNPPSLFCTRQASAAIRFVLTYRRSSSPSSLTGSSSRCSTNMRWVHSTLTASSIHACSIRKVSSSMSRLWKTGTMRPSVTALSAAT